MATHSLEPPHRPDRPARAAGADAADAVLISGTSLGVQRRLGKTEHVERSEGRDLGLRVFLGKRAAIVSSTTLDPSSFTALADRAVAMASVVPEDPYAGLAETAAAPEPVALDLDDPAEPDTAALLARAGLAEDAALAVPGINNSEGASAGYGRTEAFLVTSAGFAGRACAHQPFGLSDRPGRHRHRYAARLRLPLHGASRRSRRPGRNRPKRRPSAQLPALTRHARPLPSCRWSTTRASSGGLLGHFAGAINGASVARGTSFLKDKIGARIFAPGIAIHDDPRRVRGPAHAPSMVRARPPRPLIHRGRRFDHLAARCRSARQLGLTSTAMPRAAPAGRPRRRPPICTWRPERCRRPSSWPISARLLCDRADRHGDERHHRRLQPRRRRAS